MPSLPPTDPSTYRHLGRSQRSGTAPAILGLLALFVLIAVPLYLWRRPKPAAALESAKSELDGGHVNAPAQVVPEPTGPKLQLSVPKTVRCGARGGRYTKDRCDELTSIADVMSRAIRENLACAPVSAAPFSVSFVLTVDFERKQTHLWAGRSGTLRRRAAADLIRCVEHAITKPDWAATPHQFARYEVNVIASYPATFSPPAGPAQAAPAVTRTSAVPPGGP